MSSVTSASESSTLPMPTYIQFLSKVPYKAIPIISVSLLATNHLIGWEMTAFKLAVIGFGSGAFLPAMTMAKSLINYPTSFEKPTITPF